MGYHTGIVEPLRDFGLDVGFVPGWERRGSSAFWPAGAVDHHDAIETRWTYPPDILISGRPDLAGPLCNTALQSTGKVWLVAAGRANHAGEGHWLDLTDNADVWGTEAQNGGTGQEWPDEQMEGYERLNAAVCAYLEVDASTVCRHAEWAPTRKIDPAGPWEAAGRWEDDMGAYRARVAELLAGGGQPIDQPLEDDMILRIKGKPALFIGGLPHLVPGPLVDRYAKGRQSGIVDLPNDDGGRDHYEKVAALVKANN